MSKKSGDKPRTPKEEMEEALRQVRSDDPNYVPPKSRLLIDFPNLSSTNADEMDISDIPLIDFASLREIIPKPIEYVFYPCLPTQGLAFIYAKTGVGKTLFTLNLAYAIAGGGRFLKYSCPKLRKVLYVDGEMPFNQIHMRLMNIFKEQGKLFDESYFKIITPDILIPWRVLKIDNEYSQKMYERVIKQHGIEVIVFDNLSVLTSIDENKSDEWKIIQDWFLYLRSIGKTVIVVHHAGKDFTGYRGTSRMLDCVDVAISLQPVKEEGIEEDNPSATKFKLIYHKARLFGGKEANPYEITLENQIWSHRSMDLSNIDKVVERLNIGMTQVAIAKEMGVSQPYVNKLIKKARMMGMTSR